MHRFIVITTVLLIQAGLPVSAATFEGDMDYRVEMSNGMKQTMQYQFKGTRVRINPAPPVTGFTIFNGTEKTIYALNPERKTAMKLTMKSNPASKPRPASPKRPGNFTDTGRKEKIAGYSCSVYTFQTENVEGEMCASKELGEFPMSQFTGRPGAASSFWAEGMPDKNFFPLKIVTRSANGNGMTLEATRIDKKSLPDSLFKVPPDYTVTEGLSAMGAMGNPPR